MVEEHKHQWITNEKGRIVWCAVCGKRRNKMEESMCSVCKIPMKRYYSKELEADDVQLARSLGIRIVKGHLACPVHYQLKKGEYWLNYKRNHFIEGY